MYTLNTEAAKKADVIGAYINETGKYTGTFIRAEKLVSAKASTDGIGFTFKDDAGRECRFDIWTQKQTGEALPGLNQINAMMACLQQRALTVSQQNVKKWDNGAEVTVPAPCFAELMGKRIGLLLRSEEYEKMKDGAKTGERGWRMGLFAVFQADTELMATEILGRKTQPEQLAKVTAQLADKPLKAGGKPAAAGGAHSQSFAAMDDDIPFAFNCAGVSVQATSKQFQRAKQGRANVIEF